MPNTMTLISTATVGSGGAGTMSFSSIPQIYTDLKLVLSARATRTGTDISTSAGVSFNGDSGSYYSNKMIEGGYDSTRSTTGSSETRLERFDINADDSSANTFSSSEMYICDYTGNRAKSISYESVVENNGVGNYMYLTAGLYNPPSNTAITSITLTSLYSSTFQQNTTAYLYGIKNS